MTVMSVGFPSVVLWHVVCPQLCRALPQTSHLTRLWQGITNHHLALLPQKSDCCHSAFNEVLAEKAVRRSIGSNSVRLSILCTLTYLPSLLSQNVSRFITGFFSRLFVPYRDSVSVLSVVDALWSDADAIHECIWLSRTVTCGTVDCTFVGADAWLDFCQDLVSLWPKNSSR